MIKNERFLETACIPQHSVSLALVSDIKKDITDELQRLGVRSISPGRLEGISGAESLHADMSFCYLGEGELLAALNAAEEPVKLLRGEGLLLQRTANAVSAAAPGLNARILNDKLLCCTKTAASELLSRAESRGLHILHTNQRYTACSSAVISENAMITSDESIYRLCLANKLDALKITHGHIELEGYSYGFIGGCCGLIARDAIAFSGDVTMHPDYESMRAFAANYGVSFVSLSRNRLYDIGGIMPVKERA